MLKLTGGGVIFTVVLLTACTTGNVVTTYHPMRTSYYYPYSPYIPVTNIYAPSTKIYKDYYVPDYWIGDRFEGGLNRENWIFY